MMSDVALARSEAWYRRRWFVGLAAGLVGLLVGVGLGASADPKETEEYQALVATNSELEEDLSQARSDAETALADLAAAEQQIGDLPAREQALKEGQAALAAAKTAVANREAAAKQLERQLREREKAVGIIEKEIEQNTIGGDGLYEVGVDMKAGTYKSVDNADCYYAVLGDPNGNNILNNNIVTGPAVVSVSAGQFFETTSCSEWVLQR